MSNVTMHNKTISSNFSMASFEIAPPALIMSLKLVTAWIIITNGLVLLCLIFNRRALKNFVNLQILSMSLTDVLLGISFIPVIMTFQDIRSFSTFWSCFSVICAYTVAQHATIHHALAICVYRLIKIKGLTLSSETNPKQILKKLCAQILMPWAECILYVGSVFMIFGKHNKSIRFCSLNELFEDSYIEFMSVCLLNTVVPHIAMDVIYVYILVFLKRRWARISTMRTGEVLETSTKTPAPVTSSASADDTAETKLSDRHRTIFQAQPGRSVDRSLLPTLYRNPSTTKDKYETDRNTLNINHGTGTKIKRIAPRQTELSKAQAEAKVKDEKSVIITIGLFLLVLNVFMTPVSMIAIIELFATSPLSRQVKFSMVIFPLINSIANPIIYMLRIKPLREVIQSAWRKLCEKLC